MNLVVVSVVAVVIVIAGIAGIVLSSYMEDKTYVEKVSAYNKQVVTDMKKAYEEKEEYISFQKSKYIPRYDMIEEGDISSVMLNRNVKYSVYYAPVFNGFYRNIDTITIVEYSGRKFEFKGRLNAARVIAKVYTA